MSLRRTAYSGRKSRGSESLDDWHRYAKERAHRMGAGVIRHKVVSFVDVIG